jgi:IS30 family transposase
VLVEQGVGFREAAAEHLDTVAAEPNDRPHKTLNRNTPAERTTTLLAN